MRYSGPRVLSILETLNRLIEKKISICRFGDGEYSSMLGYDVPLQLKSNTLTNKLREIVASEFDGLLICISDIFGDQAKYIDATIRYNNSYLSNKRGELYYYLKEKTWLCSINRLIFRKDGV